MVRHWLEALFNPLVICLVLLLIASVSLWLGNERSKWLVSVATIGLLLMSLPFLPRYFTEKIEKQYPPVTSINNQIKWVVVLSGGQVDSNFYPANDRLYGASIKRLLTGIRLFKQLPAAKLLLSGGGYKAAYAEAKSLAKTSGMLGINKEDIVLEPESANTAAQAIAIAKMIPHEQSFYLVTSAIHMPRSLQLFQKVGLNPIPAASDYTLYWQDERTAKRWMPAAQNMIYSSILLHEWVGIVFASFIKC